MRIAWFRVALRAGFSVALIRVLEGSRFLETAMPTLLQMKLPGKNDD